MQLLIDNYSYELHNFQQLQLVLVAPQYLIAYSETVRIGLQTLPLYKPTGTATETYS